MPFFLTKLIFLLTDNEKPVQSSSTIQTNDSFSQQLKKFRKYQI